MGHFGRSPITRVWLLLVFPGLHPQLPGTGRLDPGRSDHDQHPFFLLAPSWARLPMVFLAAAATVIASQAVITGASRRPAGRPARLPAAATRRCTPGGADRPGLRAVDQLVPHDLRAHARGHLRDLGGAGLRVRHGRDRHDHDHDPPLLLRRPPPVGKAALDRGGRAAASSPSISCSSPPT